MTSPWWATVNVVVGNIIWTWIATPILYYSNAFGMDSTLKSNDLPVLNTGSLFNKNGTRIAALSLYNQKTYDINMKAYESNSPIYISTFFALFYGSNFLGVTAAFTHVILWYGQDITRQFKDAFIQTDNKLAESDVHNELMKNYPDFSDGQYLIFLFFCLLMQIAVGL